ncbi:MAG: hypothetical protein Q8876_05675 [Bacillota bacterium]|nr:hypothetical protein [Bacillota bacterium]
MSESHIKFREVPRDYRTEIPNIVFELLENGIISPNDFTLYSVYRRIAGEHGACWVGTRGLEKRTHLSDKTIIKSKKVLSTPLAELDGKSLIDIIPCDRKKEIADTIIINDIWLCNYNTFKNKLTCRSLRDTGAGNGGTRVPEFEGQKKEPKKKEPKKKGNACKTGIAEALPSSIEDRGNGVPRIIKPSTTRKFKRSKAHQDAFEWLLSLGLTDHQNSLSEDAISVLSHEYSKKRLEDTYSHMMYKISEGFEPKSRIAFFKHLLKKEHCPITSNCEINSKSAKNYASEVGWHSLVIKDKYVEDKNFAGKDIPLNMDDEEFFRQLVKLHESITGI